MGAALLALAACHKEQPKEDREIITERPETQVDNSIHSLAPLDDSDTCSYKKHHYQFRIVREVLDSAHVVISEDDLRYLDNAITLTVSRDGAPFLTRRLTKTAFDSDLTKQTRERGILLSLLFDRVIPEGLVFKAYVGSEDVAETQVIFRVIVTHAGGFRYEQGDVFDEEDIQRIDDPQAQKDE